MGIVSVGKLNNMDKELYKELKERIANRAKLRRQQRLELQNLIKMDEQKRLIELLEILLKHSGDITHGLCSLAMGLWGREVYTRTEYEDVMYYIKEHKPFHARLFDLRLWYPEGEKWRRVRLIEKWIRKEKDIAANFTIITTHTHNVL